MRLLVNHQLTPIAIQPKSISLEQICYKRPQSIAVISLHCLLFSTSKNKDLKRISKSATNEVLAMKFLWTSKFVFPYNVLKSTIKLHSLRSIRSLKFLHLKFLTIIFKTMIREFVGDISVMFEKKISKNNSNSTEIYVVIQRKE